MCPLHVFGTDSHQCIIIIFFTFMTCYLKEVFVLSPLMCKVPGRNLVELNCVFGDPVVRINFLVLDASLIHVIMS